MRIYEILWYVEILLMNYCVTYRSDIQSRSLIILLIVNMILCDIEKCNVTNLCFIILISYLCYRRWPSHLILTPIKSLAMKKVIFILMSFAILFAMCACQDSNEPVVIL